MSTLVDTSNFVHEAHKRMRYGDLSREPLLLLRVEWKGDSVECDWLIRPIDPWDKCLPEKLARESQTLQALRDALNLREIVFRCFPAVDTALLRMFRSDAERQLELVMTGSVSRNNEELHRVSSVAMRAKLCGFHFTLAEGALKSMAGSSLECC